MSYLLRVRPEQLLCLDAPFQVPPVLAFILMRKSSEYGTHLHGPPPFSCMHIMIHLYVLCIIGVVFLWGKAKIQHEVGIAKKRFDTVNDVTVKNFTHFRTNNRHMVLKTRLTTQIIIDDLVQLPCILER